MFAVIKTGGKQYRVSPEDVIRVEKLAVEPGSKITMDQVLMVGGDGEAQVGAPLLDKAKVFAKVVEQTRGDKIIVFRKKRRKRYKRTMGHRQDITVLRITDISPDGKAPKAAKSRAKPKAKAEAAPAAAKTEAETTAVAEDSGAGTASGDSKE